MKPLILITNDDGIHSPGLAAAACAAADLADILIVAPHTQQTGMARAFPRTEDAGIIEEEWIQINGQKVRGYGVHGSPALAVAHGVLELAERKPDLCISGVNYGENMGAVLTCSGTLGAAFEAISHGIPAIAISLEAELAIQRSNDFRQTDWDAAKRMLHSWISRVLDRGMPEYVDLININMPAGSGHPDEFRITSLSRQNYFEFIRPKARNLKEPFALKSRLSVDMDTLERDSDIHAVYVDRITSVTPINMNMSIGLKEAMVEKYM